MSTQNLMKVTYYDQDRSIRLTGYADTVVWDEQPRPLLAALRFGGYPEAVRGLSDAIYGGATITIESDNWSLQLNTTARQYRRELGHDGVYAEATLVLDDDGQGSKGDKDNKDSDNDKEPEKPSSADGQDDFGIEEVSRDLPPRNTYIFCTPGNRRELFDAVDQKTAVPMIPEYQDYVLQELERRGYLRPLKVISLAREMEAWVLRCDAQDKNIVAVLEEGLRSGAIAIPGGVPGDTPLDHLNSVTDYLNTFGVTIAERIKQLFVPLFDPAKEPLSLEVLMINQYIQEHAGYSLYDAQLAVSEAIKRRLQKSKIGLIVAECGSGKTKIGTVSIVAVAAGLLAHQQAVRLPKAFNIVLCPSHITKKWVREIEESVPNAFAAVVHSIGDFDRLYQMYERGTKTCFAILSKEKARDGYMRVPAVVYRKWNREGLPIEREPALHDGAATEFDVRQDVFCCPECGAVVMANVSKDGTVYRVPANSTYFAREYRDNHKCEACGAPLWSALNPDAWKKQTAWGKIGNYGFVYRPLLHQHFRKAKSGAIKDQMFGMARHPDAPYPARGANRSYALSSYIKKKYKGRIYGLIVDELHQYNNASGQGDAMAELFGTAKKVVGMTATLINGYSSGIFHLLYRIVPSLMKKDGKDYEAPGRFDAEYGVIQNVYEEAETEYNSNRRTVKSKKASRLLPGVSPLVYTRFLLEYAAFLMLTDMGKDLPEYEEIPVPLKMPKAVREEYEKIERVLTSFLKRDRKAARKILSSYLNLLTAYPDQPYGHRPIYHPLGGLPIVEPKDTVLPGTLMPKDEKLLEIAEPKLAAGEKVIVYTNWTRLDTQKRLLKLLTERGWRTTILPAKVKPEKREDWVNARLSEGLQVLIANPSLMETGLDLNAFTTLFFYDTGYKLFTLRQASRRSWRINQTAPRVEVYMLYYAQTMQHKAIKLMANKLAAAGIIEGSFSEEGLAAMSECEDMATLMAKELMLGIKDSVEDLAATFKRMALLKPQQAEWSIFSDTLTARDHTKLVERTPDQPVVEFAFENHAEAPSTASNPWVDTIPENGPPTVFKATVNPRKSKKFEISEDQIMLFKIA